MKCEIELVLAALSLQPCLYPYNTFNREVIDEAEALICYKGVLEIIQHSSTLHAQPTCTKIINFLKKSMQLYLHTLERVQWENDVMSQYIQNGCKAVLKWAEANHGLNNMTESEIMV